MNAFRRAAIALLSVLGLGTASAQTAVFINEIHYDNTGGDVGEMVEIAGPAATDLAGWSVVLYNGANGLSYGTIALSGTLPDSCAGLGTLMFTPPGSIQNGSPDGLALVDDLANVIQFLSYEGSFTANDGPAMGMGSVDIGVSEASSTPVGDSLQLTGMGQFYEDFMWVAAQPNTFGACNTGQTFTGMPAAPELLITEVVVTPTSGEFIEIHNPGSVPIDLTDVYLTDATFSSGGTFYYNIVTGTNAGGGGFSDFLARFPAGAMIAAGEYQTVALNGSDNFMTDYGVAPTYELFEDAIAADGIPDMLEGLPGSINNQGGLTNGGEIAILFQWDGVSDLVSDLDYAVWGDKDEAVDKTGVAIDGPDGDAMTSTYLNDTAIPAQDVIAAGGHAGGNAFARVDLAEGSELQVGGNGIGGDDETSENLSTTWTETTPSPNAPTPMPPMMATLVINEIHADPDATIAGDANGDGTREGSEDEFFELINVSGMALDISGWILSDAASTRHVFPAGTVLADQCGVVVFGGGTPTGAFGNALVQTASTGFLGLNNGGDTLTLNDGASDVLMVTYGGEGGNNQSITLDPDLTGMPPYVQHSTATGSGGALFSPGTAINGGLFPGCVAGPGVVVNEINADPDATNGDANGDGAVSTTQDEFVEVVNTSGGTLDLTGWTLADGVGVRHSFPAGTLVPDQCAIVVFSGGTPTGTFGNALVQTASTGSLGLNNGGDSVTLNDGVSDVLMVSYGAEGGNNQSITLDPDVTGMPPYVQHSTATGSGGALFSPGTRIDGMPFAGCPTGPLTLEIFEIQGPGAASAFDGQMVTSNDNIVTAVGFDGFFMQTPDARDDGDPETSNGIFVFTGAAPTVAVGDQVDVTADVIEFFGFTELGNTPVVSVDSSGNPLPAAVVFDLTTPSPDPALPSCMADTLECFEGMRVTMSGITTGPSQSFGSDPIAEPEIAFQRTFREPGIEFPGLPGLPVWDGNPEVFELDPDALGLANRSFNVGVTFTAEGAIGYEFNDYELWPSTLTVNQENPLPVPVRTPMAGEMTVGSLNLFRLFNDIDDPPQGPRDDTVVSTMEYQVRRDKFVRYIVDVLDTPDILAVEEAESLVVLNDLAADILADSGVTYTAQLIEGNDVGTIDVGFLVRSTVAVDAVTQLGAGELLTFDNSLLHDRPPLLLEGRYQGNGADFPVAVMVNHTRSLGGIDDAVDGPRVRQKRLEQSQSIAQKAQDFQTANPQVPLVLVGDFNAFEFSDSYVDVIGQIRGVINPAENLLSGPDLVNPDLTNQVLSLAASERYSFNFRGNSQTLDHALTSAAADPWVRGFEFGRGNADAPEGLIDDDTTSLRSSDHDGFVLFLMTDFDADGVADDLDNCPVDANPGQEDVDLDGQGDACDSCDASAPPVFAITSTSPTRIEGTVTQCAGVFSVTLDPGSNNVQLNILSGLPGDPVWVFELVLIDASMPGSATLSADGSTSSSMSGVLSLGGAVGIPTLSVWGLALMVFLTAGVARRRLTL